jgi:hypothetical protein
MELKRIYNHDSGEPVLSAVKVLKAGAEQKFSQRIIDQLVAEGVMAIDGDLLALSTEPALTYRITRRPGTYCCYCNAAVDPGPSALAHVAEHLVEKPKTLGGKMLDMVGLYKPPKNPDPNNPSGYRRDNFYFCERV